MSFTVEQLAAKIFLYSERSASNRNHASSNPNEFKLVTSAWHLLLNMKPDLASGDVRSATEKIKILATGYFKHLPMRVPQPIGANLKPLFTPQEEAMLKQLPAVQRSLMEMQFQMQKQALMTSVMTNLQNMQHEMSKGIVRNLRG